MLCGLVAQNGFLYIAVCECAKAEEEDWVKQGDQCSRVADRAPKAVSSVALCLAYTNAIESEYHACGTSL